MPKHEQGVQSDRYMVIPRCLVFITMGDQVLMLKGAANKRIWANKYNGIGGHIERGEDPLSAARRELKEEANLVGCDLRLCGVAMVDAEERVGIAIYIYRGEYQGGEIVACGEGELEWLRIDKLDRYALVEDLFIILPRLFALKIGDEPLSMHYHYDEDERLRVEFG